MNIYATRIIILLLFLSAAKTFAQPRGRMPQDRFTSVFIEASNFISDKPGKSRLDINFRIPYEFFVFVRDPEGDGQDTFKAGCEISIEILDKGKSSVAREVLKKHLQSDQASAPQTGGRFLQGMVSFDLPPGLYSIIFEVNDRESPRTFRNDARTIELRDFEKAEPEFSDILFCQGADSQGLISPINYGGDVSFGKIFDAYFELRGSQKPESVNISCRLYRNKPEAGDSSFLFGNSISGNSLLATGRMRVITREGEYIYKASEAASRGKYGCLLNFGGDTLTEGSYSIELSATISGVSCKTNRQFHIRWFGMPMSLRNLKTAVEALEYITGEQEFHRMKSADASTQKELFEAFWKKRDNTPQTAFNEVMEEYYRRVDHATSAFGTMRQPNGYKTERGKAYIFYGPPAEIKRELTPGSEPRETWGYPNLHLKLIFADKNRTGEYKLEKTEETK